VFTAVAKVTEPPATGHIDEPVAAVNPNLSASGYEEQEFFVSGTAHAFRGTSTPPDGQWTITPTTSAPYETRILVRRPSDPSKFNGTVIVEWMNVTAGETAADWQFLNPMLMREGFAWVGVSVQALAVNGGNPLINTPTGGSGPLAAEAAQAVGGLVKADPSRYGSLHHPGDQYAYDIFDQVGRAVRDEGRTILGGEKPSHVVAAGESQSAVFLTTYTNAIQPLSNTFDGIFIHSRFGGAPPISSGSITSGNIVTRIRTDLKVPVFMSETQTDVIQFDYASARQPNTHRIRTWEVAGTSHADAFLVGPALSFLGCTQQINTGPQHEVVQAGFTAFADWVKNGTPPPSPSPFKLRSTRPPALALDAHGNVIGGVRTPSVDVPISTLSGATPPGASLVCSLFGTTIPFRPATLTALYGSEARYQQQYQRSLDDSIQGGYILGADRASLVAMAQQVAIP
jgi:hypothetical protein